MASTLTPTRLREWLERITLDELRQLADLMNAELDRREGRKKYRLPYKG